MPTRRQARTGKRDTATVGPWGRSTPIRANIAETGRAPRLLLDLRVTKRLARRRGLGAVHGPAGGLDDGRTDHRPNGDPDRHEETNALHRHKPDRHLAVVLHEGGGRPMGAMPGDWDVARVADEHRAAVAGLLDCLRAAV